MTSETRETVARVRRCLETQDLQGALAILNATTPHRFTAIYRFEGEMLKNLSVFDRLDGRASLFPTIPVNESYCMYVREPEEFFALEDASADPRVADHAKRATVRSYCGVAVHDDDGQIFGSLCHFDFAPFPIAAGAFDLLEEVARVLRSEFLRALRGSEP